MRSTRSSSASHRKYPTTSKADRDHRSDRARMRSRTRSMSGCTCDGKNAAPKRASDMAPWLSRPQREQTSSTRPRARRSSLEIGRLRPSGLEALPVGEVVVGIALVEEDDTREPDAFGKLSDLGLARPLDRARVGELAVASGREGKDASDTRIDE